MIETRILPQFNGDKLQCPKCREWEHLRRTRTTVLYEPEENDTDGLVVQLAERASVTVTPGKVDGECNGVQRLSAVFECGNCKYAFELCLEDLFDGGVDVWTETCERVSDPDDRNDVEEDEEDDGEEG